MSPDNFARNGKFVAYMHTLIEKVGLADAALIALAEKVGEGDINLTDRRATAATPDPEDLVGAFTVSGGKLVSYSRNAEHRILSERGFFRLPAPFESTLIETLTRMVE